MIKVLKVVNLSNSNEQKEWLNNACHSLKNDKNSALTLLEEMRELEKKQRVPKKLKEGLLSAITYFTNHHNQMNYLEAISNNIPICSGARWSHCGADNILMLRAISRWKQFWAELVG